MTENMTDPETGLICGLWDVAQQKHVAIDRQVANLPLFAQFIIYDGDGNENISWDVYSRWIAAMLEYECVEVNGKLYYAPGGIDENNSIIININDLHCPSLLKYISRQWSLQNLQNQERRLNLLEAVANSLQLVLEGQELNPTHLTTDEILVTFTGDSYNIKPIGEQFNIISAIIGYSNEDLEGGAGGSDRWLEDVKSGEKLLSDKYNVEELIYAVEKYQLSYKIVGIYYKMSLNIYNFQRIESADTRFAPAYNVNTGEPIFNQPIDDTEAGEMFSRYGFVQEAIAWVKLSGFFGDEYMLEDALNLLIDCRTVVEKAVFNYDYHVERDFQYFMDTYPTWSVEDVVLTGDIARYLINNIAMQQCFQWGGGSLAWRESSREYLLRYAESLDEKYGNLDFKLTDERKALVDEMIGEPNY